MIISKHSFFASHLLSARRFRFSRSFSRSYTPSIVDSSEIKGSLSTYLKPHDQQQQALAGSINHFFGLSHQPFHIARIPLAPNTYAPLPIVASPCPTDDSVTMDWLRTGLDIINRQVDTLSVNHSPPVRQGQCHIKLPRQMNTQVIAAAIQDLELELCEYVNNGILKPLVEKYHGGLESFNVQILSDRDLCILADIHCGGAHGATRIIDTMETLAQEITRRFPELRAGYSILTSAPLTGSVDASFRYVIKGPILPAPNVQSTIYRFISRVAWSLSNDTRSTAAGLLAFQNHYSMFNIHQHIRSTTRFSCKFPLQLTTVGLAGQQSHFKMPQTAIGSTTVCKAVGVASLAILLGSIKSRTRYPVSSFTPQPTLKEPSLSYVLTPATFGTTKWRDMDLRAQRDTIQRVAGVDDFILNHLFTNAPFPTAPTFATPLSIIPLTNSVDHTTHFLPFSSEEISVIPGILNMFKIAIQHAHTEARPYSDGIEVTATATLNRGIISQDMESRFHDGERFARLSWQRAATDGKGAMNATDGLMRALNWHCDRIYEDTAQNPNGFYQRFHSDSLSLSTSFTFRFPYDAVPKSHSMLAQLVGSVEHQMHWAAILGLAGGMASKYMLAGEGARAGHGTMHSAMKLASQPPSHLA